VKAEGSTFLLTDGLLILYAPHIASSVPWYPVANPQPIQIKKCVNFTSR
jgi:hypothetical protein